MENILLTSISIDDLIERIALRTAEIISQKSENITTQSKENFLTIEEAASFLKISVHTIYSKVSRKELPSMKRNGRLYFSNLDLVNYLKSGRKITNEEINDEAENYLFKNKK